MTNLAQILCEDTAPHGKNKGQLKLTISSIIGLHDYDTSVFTLDKSTGDLVFSHFYKDISYTNGVEPRVEASQSVPLTLSPGGHLYGIALSEMLTYAQNCLNGAHEPKDRQRTEAFVRELERIVRNQNAEVLK